MDYPQSLDYAYHCVFFLSTERHSILWAAKLTQHIYFKDILTSKFGSKDLLLWKKGYSFVSTENANLSIPS